MENSSTKSRKYLPTGYVMIVYLNRFARALRLHFALALRRTTRGKERIGKSRVWGTTVGCISCNPCMKKRTLSRGWDVDLFPGRRFRTRVSHVLYDQTHALSFFFIVASSCLVLDYDTYCLIKAWRCLCLAFS